jgi:hypothetical protein
MIAASCRAPVPPAWEATFVGEPLGFGVQADFVGYVSNSYGYMRQAAVLAVLIPFLWTFGQVMIEAMAGGALVTSTDCQSGICEIRASGWYGRLVPVGNPASVGGWHSRCTPRDRLQAVEEGAFLNVKAATECSTSDPTMVGVCD